GSLLDLESDHFDYGIEEQLEKETLSEQMAVDVEITKVNISKAPIELDIYGSQNESEEGDYSPKRSETTHLIKKNDMVNLALMEINPNKASGESNMEINPMQKVKIIVSAKQTSANHNHNTKGKGIVTGSNAIKIINKRSFSSSGDNRDINLQKVISGRTRCESLKEQDRETSRVRSKESDESTVAILTRIPVVYESVDKPVGSLSRVSSVNTNRKGLLQKEVEVRNITFGNDFISDEKLHNIMRLLGVWLNSRLNERQLFLKAKGIVQQTVQALRWKKLMAS
ncbi:38349_t:CDS:2, partial [Gigaspora margarita]